MNKFKWGPHNLIFPIQRINQLPGMPSLIQKTTAKKPMAIKNPTLNTFHLFNGYLIGLFEYASQKGA